MEYRAKITKEGARTLAAFPDISGCHTFAEPDQSIADVASEALQVCLEAYLLDPDEIAPRPATRRGMAILIPDRLALKLELRWARHDAGLSQAQLARLAGVRVELLTRVEHPDYNPGLRVIEKIARALKRSVRLSLHPIR